MANRYWVGNATNWSSTASWSASSGGASGASVPTSADDVFLDALSPGNCVVDAGATCRNLDCTGFSKSLTMNAQLVCNTTAGGQVKIVNTMTVTGTGTLAFTTASGANATLTTAGRTFGGVNITGSATGGVTLGDALNVSGTLTLTNGAFNTGNFNVSCLQFVSNTANARTLTLGSSTITCTGASPWQFATSSNLTVTANTATVVMSGAGASFQSVNVVQNWNGLSLQFTGSGAASISGGGTYQNVTRTGTAVKTDQFAIYGVNALTISGNLSIQGNSLINRMFVNYATSLGVQKTVTVNGTVTLTNVDFQDISAAGTSAPWSGTSLGDCGGNVNITFPASQTRYGVVAGAWSSTATWSASSGGAGGASVPLPQDDVVLDASSAAGAYTIDMPRVGRNLTCTGFAQTLTATASLTFNVFGNVVLSSTMTFTGGTWIMQFNGRSPQSLTSNGKALSGAIAAQCAGSMVTLVDDLSTAGTLYVQAGGFSDNNRNVTVFGMACQLNQTKSLSIGTGTWTLTGNSGSVWAVSNTGSMTFTCSPQNTISVSTASASARTFTGAFLSYGNININAGVGAFQIVDANNWQTMTIQPGSNVQLGAGATQTMDALLATGNAGSRITLTSSLSGTAAQINLRGGFSNVDYCNIQDIAKIGPGFMYAGANSTNTSGNSGIIWDVYDGRPGFIQAF